MSRIEINTTQNVTIEYELSPLRDRILAFFLDLIIMWVSIIILLLFFGIASGGHGMSILGYLVMTLVFFFYNLAFEIFNGGKSLGKAALSIKVVKITGEEAGLKDYLTRWVFRMVDIYMTAGSLAAFLISSSDKKQRLGDILANTAVIKYKPNYTLTLSDLINRSSIETYQPVYPGVRKFREEDMLLVKSMIERVQSYPNQAHKEALVLLTNTIAQQLNLKETPRNRVEFLKVVLKDYIVLTR